MLCYSWTFFTLNSIEKYTALKCCLLGCRMLCVPLNLVSDARCLLTPPVLHREDERQRTTQSTRGDGARATEITSSSWKAFFLSSYRSFYNHYCPFSMVTHHGMENFPLPSQVIHCISKGKRRKKEKLETNTHKPQAPSSLILTSIC